MSEDCLRAFRQGKPDWLEEPSLRDMTPQRVVELLDTQAFFTLLKRPYPTEKGVLDHLGTERLIDAPNGLSIRRLGALLLASADDFPDWPGRRPASSSTPENRNWRRGSTRPGQRLRGRVPGPGHFVMAQLPQNEVIEEAIRRKVKLLPEIVIRELVANALIHQDFGRAAPRSMVEIYRTGSRSPTPASRSSRSSASSTATNRATTDRPT